MNFKRKRRKNSRAGCLLCKPQRRMAPVLVTGICRSEIADVILRASTICDVRGSSNQATRSDHHNVWFTREAVETAGHLGKRLVIGVAEAEAA